MGIGGQDTGIERALSPVEVKAANELTRRWFTSRPRPPAAASGLGVWPLLATLATGASGETAAELLAAVGTDAGRAGSITGSLLSAARSSPGIGMALGVWAGSRITLDPDWVGALPVDAVGTLTGEPDTDEAMLNRWAREGTDGMIERMPLDLTQRIDVVLASAIMVRTKWVTEFSDITAQFRRGPWARLGQCRRLSNTIFDDVLRVSEDVSVLTVPGRDDVDVLLALGRNRLESKRVFDVLVDAAGDRAWGRSSVDMEPGEKAPGVKVDEYRSSQRQLGPEVGVQTVRFSVSADIDLAEDAAALGLVRACDEDRARFDRLAAEPTYVSQATQSCVATFGATGFEAAALTSMAMARAGSVPQMRHTHRRASIVFDRPFAYLARHRPSGLILMGGWVEEPERAA